MRIFAIALLLLASSLVSPVSRAADMDDLKWVSKCIQDNAGASVGSEVVAMYCACMNNKMGSNESQSISQWEKTHTAEKNQCEAEAGWK